MFNLPALILNHGDLVSLPFPLTITSCMAQVALRVALSVHPLAGVRKVSDHLVCHNLLLTTRPENNRLARTVDMIQSTQRTLSKPTSPCQVR